MSVPYKNGEIKLSYIYARYHEGEVQIHEHGIQKLSVVEVHTQIFL